MVKEVRIRTGLAAIGDDPRPLVLAEYLGAYLFAKRAGAVFGRWDGKAGEGLWFYSREAAPAPFEAASVDEVIFREPRRWRFRSVVFRLGALASEGADLCGVVRLLPLEPGVDPGPGRRYVIHASFWPEAGLWFKAAIIGDSPGAAEGARPEGRGAFDGPEQGGVAGGPRSNMRRVGRRAEGP